MLMFITKILQTLRMVFVISLCSVISLSSLVAMDGTVVVSGGVSIGNGTVMGRACVINGINQLNKICQGDIVVASITDSSWNDALKLSAGIITEQGGSQSHAALLGKKLNIPVIVGVSDATKKIIDGSSITFDCCKTTVYEVPQNMLVICNNTPKHSLLSQEHIHIGRLSHGFHEKKHKESRPSDRKVKSKVSKKDKHHHLNCNGTPITRDMLSNHIEIEGIKSYLSGEKNKIWMAENLGKWAASWQISGYTYDTIPFLFCRDEEGQREALSILADGADYIQTKKEEFKETVLGKAKKINNDEIAKFLHHSIVDKIEATQEHKVILKEDPTKMDEYVREGIVNKAQYMYYTLLNFATRYYLEQELAK